MVKCNNLFENKNIEVVESRGGVKVLEYKKDLSKYYNGNGCILCFRDEC